MGKLPLVLPFALAAFTARAACEKNRVSYPEQQTVAGRPLKITGIAQRNKYVFHVYTVALYSEELTNAKRPTARDFVRATGTKRFDLGLQRNLNPNEVRQGMSSGFDHNCDADQRPGESRDEACARHREAFGQLLDMVSSKDGWREGDHVQLTIYEGGRVAAELVRGTEHHKLGEVQNKGFDRVVASLWLGNPPDGDENIPRDLVKTPNCKPDSDSRAPSEPDSATHQNR